MKMINFEKYPVASMSVITSPLSVRASTLRAVMPKGELGSISIRSVSNSPRPTTRLSCPLRVSIRILRDGVGAVLVTTLCPSCLNGDLGRDWQNSLSFPYRVQKNKQKEKKMDKQINTIRNLRHINATETGWTHIVGSVTTIACRAVSDGLLASLECAFDPHAAVGVLHNQRTVLYHDVIDITSP